MGNHFRHLNPKTGLVEVYDEESGHLVAAHGTAPIDKTATLQERLIETELLDGTKVLIDPKITPSSKWEYSLDMVERICERIAGGEKITKICDGNQLPKYLTVLKWKKMHPQCAELIAEALEARAEFIADELREIADTTDENNYQANAVKIGVYKHLAQVDNPRRFQAKPVEGQVVGNVTFIIDTGIRRPGDPGFKDVGPEKIEAPRGTKED